MVATNDELIVATIGTSVSYIFIYFLSSTVLKRLCKRKGFVLLNQQEPQQPQSRPQQPQPQRISTDTIIIHQGPSYVCSFVHSIVNGFRGIHQLIGLWNASDQTKLYFPPTYPPKYLSPIKNVEISNVVFGTYLIIDLVYVIQKYPKLGGIDTIVHHIVFLTCSIINGWYGLLPFAYSWLIVGELSTIFLNLRWFFIKTGRGGNTQTFRLIQYIFAITFFVTRVLIYVGGVYNLFYQQRSIIINDIFERKHNDVPAIFVIVTITFVGVGCILNLIWFQKIVWKVFDGGGGRRRTRTRKSISTSESKQKPE